MNALTCINMHAVFPHPSPPPEGEGVGTADDKKSGQSRRLQAESLQSESIATRITAHPQPAVSGDGAKVIERRLWGESYGAFFCAASFAVSALASAFTAGGILLSCSKI